MRVAVDRPRPDVRRVDLGSVGAAEVGRGCGGGVWAGGQCGPGAAGPHHPLQPRRQERVEIAGVEHWNTDSVEVHAPLFLFRVVAEVLHEELLGEVVEPVVVALQCGALQPRLPKLRPRAVRVADGAVVVAVGDPSGRAGDGGGRHRVRGLRPALARSPDVGQRPVRPALLPHVQVAVLRQLLAGELPELLPLHHWIEHLGVNATVSILGAGIVTHAVTRAPVCLQRPPRPPPELTRILLRAELAAGPNHVVTPVLGSDGEQQQEEEEEDRPGPHLASHPAQLHRLLH